MNKILFALMLLLTTFLLRLPVLFEPAIEEDEAQHFVAAVELAEGNPPYLSVVDGKTPLIWYLFAAVTKIAGPFEVVPIRLFTIFCVWLTALFLWVLGTICNSERAGKWAAFLFTVFSTSSFYKILASNFELHFLPFDVLAYIFLTLALVRRRSLWGIASGAAIATSFFVKQTAGINLATQLLFLIFLTLIPDVRRIAWRSGLMILLGFASTLFLYGAWMASVGVLSEMKFWIWDFAWFMTAQSAAKVPFWERLLERGGIWLLGTLVVHLWALYWVCRVWNPFRSGLQWKSQAWLLQGMILLWALLEWIPICMGGRFPVHYFLMYLPPLTLLAGFWIAQYHSITDFFFGRCHFGQWVTRIVFFVLPVTGMYAANWHIPWCNQTYGLHRADHAHLAVRIQQETMPTDRIFVWGNNPEFYVYSRRRPASRFIWCEYLVGRYGITSQMIGDPALYDAMVVPKAWPLLFKDFAANPPRLIIDTSPADLHDFRVFPISRYPQLEDYIKKYYQLAWVEDHVHFYLRKPY